jgi:hypothetical protein
MQTFYSTNPFLTVVGANKSYNAEQDHLPNIVISFNPQAF